MNIARLLKPKSTVTFLRDHHTLQEGLNTLQTYHFTALPVIDKDGFYVGTVSEGDFLWRLTREFPYDTMLLQQVLVGELIRPTFNPAVTISTSMEELLQRTTEQNFVPVVDARGAFVGIVTRGDVLKYFYAVGSAVPSVPVSASVSY